MSRTHRGNRIASLPYVLPSYKKREMVSNGIKNRKGLGLDLSIKTAFTRREIFRIVPGYTLLIVFTRA